MTFGELQKVTDANELAVFFDGSRIWCTDIAYDGKYYWDKFSDYNVRKIYPTVNHKGEHEITVCIEI